MLGLRTCPKEGLKLSPAELVFDETLAVPGDLFPPEKDSNVDEELELARQKAGRLRSFRPSKMSERAIYINRDLKDSTYVFVRNDAHRPPLSPSYRGPFRVLQRQDEAFQLDLWVTIDRLKPA